MTLRARAIGPLVLALLASAHGITPVVADDQQLGSWKVITGPPTPHPSNHTATLLKDGRVLVVGGPGPAGTAPHQVSKVVSSAADIYDPATGRWSAAPPTAVPRVAHTATLLADGRVLVAGGALTTSPFISEVAELFDPATGRWTTAGAMTHGRFGHTATLLPNGRVLVAGGQAHKGVAFVLTTSAELFDPATGRWSETGPMQVPRAEHTATLLTDGTVLVAGGRQYSQYSDDGGPSLKSAEVYNPATGAWHIVPHLMSTVRAAAAATLMPDGRVLVTGGATQLIHGGLAIPTPSAEIYDPRTMSWVNAAPLLSARFGHGATLLPGGRVLVVGGLARKLPDQYGALYENPVGAAELYDPGADRWTPVTSPPQPTTSASDRELGEVIIGAYNTATLLSGNTASSLSLPVLVIGSTGGTTAQLFALSGFADQPAVGSGSTGRGIWLVVVGAAGGAVLAGILTVWIVARRWRRRRSRAW